MSGLGWVLSAAAVLTVATGLSELAYWVHTGGHLWEFLPVPVRRPKRAKPRHDHTPERQRTNDLGSTQRIYLPRVLHDADDPSPDRRTGGAR